MAAPLVFRSPLWSVLSALLLPVLGLAAACGAGGTQIITPPPPPPTGFTLTFKPDPEDAPTAQVLGWANGLPGLTVTLTPRDSGAAPRIFASSTQGTVTIPDLTPQDYIVDASRWLSDPERAKLIPPDDALGFVAKGTVRVGAATGGSEVVVPASRRKSLMISEWAFNAKGAPGIGAYFFGGFLEIYNDADTTIYLDRMVIAEGFNVDYDYPNNTCVGNARFTNDPAGVYTRLAQAFPGTGTQYPIRPGETRVIATDAIDHRPLFPGGIDLSRSDFEFVGPADVDNPAVPNMVDVGVISYPSGHGLYWAGLSAAAVLALPVDLGQLPRVPHLGNAVYVRIPKDRILDVAWIRTNYVGSEFPECPQLLPASIDRAGFAGRGTNDQVEYDYSVSRRRIPASAAQGVRLQHTRTSNADLIRTPRSPGALAPP